MIPILHATTRICVMRPFSVPTCRAIAWLFFDFKKNSSVFIGNSTMVSQLFFQNLKTQIVQNAY